MTIKKDEGGGTSKNEYKLKIAPQLNLELAPTKYTLQNACLSLEHLFTMHNLSREPK